mmetsp:Transcript_3147/g.7174  ORF Transcript_3147/g.7174 Transcript_3147/m.7174 type:complete len:93 (+) Transcript_3147:3935-4213(+)
MMLTVSSVVLSVPPRPGRQTTKFFFWMTIPSCRRKKKLLHSELSINTHNRVVNHRTFLSVFHKKGGKPAPNNRARAEHKRSTRSSLDDDDDD